MNNKMMISTCEKNNVVSMLKLMVMRPMQSLNEYYSDVLERQLDMRQTWNLLNAQIAFLMTVFPSMSMMLRVVCLTWLVGAVVKCREALR